jgi:hypothetical protein
MDTCHSSKLLLLPQRVIELMNKGTPLLAAGRLSAPTWFDDEGRQDVVWGLEMVALNRPVVMRGGAGGGGDS